MKPALIVLVVAVLGWLVWERHFSRDAKIQSTYRACMRELGGTDKDGGGAKVPPAKGDDPAAAITKGASDVFSSVLQDVGGAMCSAVRDACTRDFDGAICQAARGRYR
ncbi:MAG: hypothetical protein U1F58_02665 [Burkholderiales bacterium]